jgi:hypothetical protein
MRLRRVAPLVLAALAAGCGNPVHSHYGVKATAACLRKLGYTVNTHLGPRNVVENSAAEGALLAKEPGNAVRITFSSDHGQAVNIMAAYHLFAPQPMRAHLGDVLSSQKNATLLWTITPPADEMQRVLGCLK